MFAYQQSEFKTHRYINFDASLPLAKGKLRINFPDHQYAKIREKALKDILSVIPHQDTFPLMKWTLTTDNHIKDTENFIILLDTIKEELNQPILDMKRLHTKMDACKIEASFIQDEYNAIRMLLMVGNFELNDRSLLKQIKNKNETPCDIFQRTLQHLATIAKDLEYKTHIDSIKEIEFIKQLTSILTYSYQKNDFSILDNFIQENFAINSLKLCLFAIFELKFILGLTNHRRDFIEKIELEKKIFTRVLESHKRFYNKGQVTIYINKKSFETEAHFSKILFNLNHILSELNQIGISIKQHAFNDSDLCVHSLVSYREQTLRDEDEYIPVTDLTKKELALLKQNAKNNPLYQYLCIQLPKLVDYKKNNTSELVNFSCLSKLRQKNNMIEEIKKPSSLTRSKSLP